MNKYRDKKTNLTLGLLCDILDNSNVKDFSFPITLVVGGQMITGYMVSEKEFYDLEFNQPLKPIFESILKEKLEYFNEDGTFKKEDITDEEIEKIPDTIWQRFIYLKNARYMMGNTFLPSENNDGTAIQVRASDVVAFSFGAFSSTKNEKV